MREKHWDISLPVVGEDEEHAPSIPSPQKDYGPTVDIGLPELVSHPGTSSGSYLQTLLTSITENSHLPLELDVRSMRTSDYEEYTLKERDTGNIVFRGAKCYGFRNLQNLVRKVGRDAGVQVGRGAAGRLAGLRGRRKGNGAGGASDKGYDYVEVMACPGGCVNGGGQLRPPAATPGKDAEGFERDWEANGVKLDGEDAGRIQGQGAKWGDKEWTKQVEVAYWHGLPTPPASLSPERREIAHDRVIRADTRMAEVDAFAARVLREMCRVEGDGGRGWMDGLDETAEKRRQSLFRTQYRAVESEVVGLAVKW